MNKPIKPVLPDSSDRVKYPFSDKSTDTYDSRFVRDYKKYQKDLEKFVKDLDLYWQTKFIEDIKRSTLKLCLKKYKITKN